MSHLRAVDGREDTNRRANIAKVCDDMADADTVVVSFCKGGARCFRAVGDVDWDAEAGFMARVLSKYADDEAGV